MSDCFVCPECGTPVESVGAGRRARCPDCLALVELPYLPRVSPARGRRRSVNYGWAGVVIAVAAGVIGVLLTYHFVRGRIRDGQRHTFETLLSDAEKDEHASEFDRALDRIDAALVMGREQSLADAARLEEIEKRRAEIAGRREAIRREAIEARATADLDAAREALRASRPEFGRAIELCEAIVSAASDVPTPRARELTEAAQALAAGLLRERGVDLPEPAGTFLDPSRGPSTYTGRVRPIVVTHLEGKGYLPSRPGSPLADLWPKHASRRLVTLVNEKAEGTYMESVLATSRLEIRFNLEDGSREVWRTQASAATREPAPRIPYPASAVFATARKRDPDAEKRLYDDALENLTSLIPTRFATLPPCVVASPGEGSTYPG